jgi:hypothetical protein
MQSCTFIILVQIWLYVRLSGSHWLYATHHKYYDIMTKLKTTTIINFIMQSTAAS